MTLLFWLDLSQTGLIEGSFTAGTMANCCVTIPLASIGNYIPQAKIGNGNYVYVWSGMGNTTTNINFFGISVPNAAVTAIDLSTTTGLTVKQAYDIDTKMDDGLPMSGNVLAYLGMGPLWAGSNVNNYGSPYYYSLAIPGSSTTCFDNNNVSGAIPRYSITQNNGANVNCALGFKILTGD